MGKKAASKVVAVEQAATEPKFNLSKEVREMWTTLGKSAGNKDVEKKMLETFPNVADNPGLQATISAQKTKLFGGGTEKPSIKPTGETPSREEVMWFCFGSHDSIDDALTALQNIQANPAFDFAVQFGSVAEAIKAVERLAAEKEKRRELIASQQG